jgi:hypothetical protein
MSILNVIEKITKEEILNLVLSSTSLGEVCKKLGYSNHGRNTKEIRIFLDKNSIDTEHFSRGGPLKKSFNIDKICPVCGKSFSVLNYGKQVRKVTCSYSCSNTYFRSGKNAGNYIDGKHTNGYGTISSFYTKHCIALKCAHCNIDDILDIHHADEDRSNNLITNLVLLCPNDHLRWHRHKDTDVMESIIKQQDLIDTLL